MIDSIRKLISLGDESARWLIICESVDQREYLSRELGLSHIGHDTERKIRIVCQYGDVRGLLAGGVSDRDVGAKHGGVIVCPGISPHSDWFEDCVLCRRACEYTPVIFL